MNDLGIEFSAQSEAIIPSSAIKSFTTYYQDYYSITRYFSVNYASIIDDEITSILDYNSKSETHTDTRKQKEFLYKLTYNINLLFNQYSSSFLAYLENIENIRTNNNIGEVLTKYEASIDENYQSINYVPNFDVLQDVTSLIEIDRIADDFILNGSRLMIKKHLEGPNYMECMY